MLLLVLLLLPLDSMIMTGISTQSHRASLPHTFQSPSPIATPERPDCKKCRRPTSDGSEIFNEPPDVTDVVLEKTELRLPCVTGDEQLPTTLAFKDSAVTVKTLAEDPEGDVLTYNYTISGGRIVGTGANVIWNLSAIAPGTYVITAGVDDGCGVCGKTKTKVVVVECS